MKKLSLWCTALILSACQTTPQMTQPVQPPSSAEALSLETPQTGAVTQPVVVQKSPVLPPVKRKPEGQLQIQDQKVTLLLKLPPLDTANSAFRTQALDLTGDNATLIVATVSDSHGQTYTPVGADGDGKVAYPANGELALNFSNVVPDQLLFLELQIEDNGTNAIPQADLAAVVSQTGTADVTAPVNFQTTPTAKAMKALVTADAARARAINLPGLVTKMQEITGITGGTDPSYTTHPTLVNTAQLATDLATQQPSALNASDYRLVGATVNLTVNGLVGSDTIQVDITDAASTRATNVGATGSITGATPGNGLRVEVGAEGSNTTQYTFAINPTTVDLTNNTATPVTITATPVAVTITNLTPTAGAIGSTVTIAGTGFSTATENNTVNFGSTPATVNSVNGTGTSMVVQVPSGISGTQTVTVEVGSQTSNGSDYEVRPVISSLSSPSATVGSTLTITGTGFSPTDAQNTVNFGSTSAAITSASATELVVTVPAGIAGSQPVTVEVGNQTSADASFNVIPVLNTLGVAAATPDTVLTLTGSGFSQTLADNTIQFGGVTVNPTSVNAGGTSMDVTVPNVFGSMDLNVEVDGQSSVNRTFESIPKITNVSAATGSTGDSITLTGKGFHTTLLSNIVKLGAVDATVSAASATSITLTVPEMPANIANATVQVGNQTSATANFSVVPEIASLTTAETVNGKAVLIRSQVLTLTGTNFDPVKANNSVTFTLSNAAEFTVTGANLNSATATAIQVVVPAGVDVAGDVDITVNTNGQTHTLTAQATVPTVTLNINNGGFH